MMEADGTRSIQEDAHPASGESPACRSAGTFPAPGDAVFTATAHEFPAAGGLTCATSACRAAALPPPLPQPQQPGTSKPPHCFAAAVTSAVPGAPCGDCATARCAERSPPAPPPAFPVSFPGTAARIQSKMLPTVSSAPTLPQQLACVSTSSPPCVLVPPPPPTAPAPATAQLRSEHGGPAAERGGSGTALRTGTLPCRWHALRGARCASSCSSGTWSNITHPAGGSAACVIGSSSCRTHLRTPSRFGSVRVHHLMP